MPWCLDGHRLLAEMDRYGCAMVWMSAADPGYAGAMDWKNDFVFDLADEWPDRVVPYCSLSANEPAGCLGELRRCLGRGRCVGVKMHRYEQPRYTLESDFLQPVFEVLDEKRMVYLNHCFEDHAALVWAAERYPHVTFLAGHMDSRINDLAVRHANIRDCTCAAESPGAVTAEVRRLGRSDTMLVGSDVGLFSLSFGMGAVAYGDMAEEDKSNILGRNALRLLARMGWQEGL